MNKVKEKNNGLMTEDSILKHLIVFAFPLLLGNLFQQLYNTVDSVIVGKFIGSEALAAVNSSTPIVNFLISFCMGISVGAGVVISQYYGARNHKKLHEAVHTTIAFAIVAGIVMTLIGVLFSPLILKLMGTPKEVMQESTNYLKIYFAGIMGIIIYNMVSGILRAVGDSKSPLYFLIVSSVVNIILDLVFVVIFKMGVSGVAIATLIAQFISALLTMLVLIRSKKEFRVTIRDIKFYNIQLRKIVKIGLPSGIQNAIVSLSNVIVQTNINSFGALAMAGCGTYTKVDGFAILPVMSFSMALTTFIGQNIGAKKYERVKKGSMIGIKLSISSTVFISIILMLFAPSILKIFSNDPKVIEYGILMMKVLAPSYFLLSLSHAFSGILRGAGLTKIPMVVMIFSWCFLRMAWILTITPLFRDIRLVFLAYPITWFTSSLILYLYYKKADWMNNPSKIS